MKKYLAEVETSNQNGAQMYEAKASQLHVAVGRVVKQWRRRNKGSHMGTLTLKIVEVSK